MDNPDFVRELDGVDDAKGIDPKRESDLKDAGTEALHRFRDVRFAALGCDRERR